ncbi:hypothetical protein HUJ05_005150 [Dendroctonus ponderosae]|nr:hypothetical protein HUJ05_005150 [Dendroctonus ponderosae]
MWRTIGLCRKIQGFAWFVLSVVCIVFYYIPTQVHLEYEITNQTPYTDLLTFCLYENFLNRNNRENNRQLISRNFHIFIWIYTVLSVIWMGLAIAECITIFRRRAHKHSNHILLSLGIATLLMCTLDTIIYALAWVDYLAINPFDYTVAKCDVSENCDFDEQVDTQFRYQIGRKIAYGIAMTLFARGYLLWIFNWVAGVSCMVASIRRFQLPPILQYDDTIPRPRILRRSHGTLDSGRSSVYEDDGYFDEPPATKLNNWYNQEPPKPAAYHAQSSEPRFLNSNRNTQGF